MLSGGLGFVLEMMVPSVDEGPGRRPSLSGDIGLCSVRLLSPRVSLGLTGGRVSSGLEVFRLLYHRAAA